MRLRAPWPITTLTTPLMLPLSVTDLLIGLALVGGLVWVASRMIWPWIESMQNATKRSAEDASGENVPVPDAVQSAIRYLEGQGFTLVGVTKTALPQAIGYTWNMLSADGDINAEVVPYASRAAVAFNTMLDDESALETSTPIGEKIRTPAYWADWTRQGADEALRLHREHMAEFLSRRASAVKRVRSVADVVEHERIFRARHYRRKLRPGLMRGVWLTVFLAIAVLNAVIATAATRAMLQAPDPLASPAAAVALAALIIGVPSLLLMFYVLWRIVYHAGA